MATIIANVIDVSAPQFVKTARGGYNFIEVAYKKDGKVEGKKVTDFGHDKAKEIFSFLKTVVAGDVLNVTLEKVNDFWTWVGVEKEGDGTGNSVAASPTSAASPTNAGSTSKPGRVVGSNYETSDERAARQRYIVRQSSFTSALDLLKHNSPKGGVDLEAVFDTAKKIEAYVFDPTASLVAMKDDIPE